MYRCTLSLPWGSIYVLFLLLFCSSCSQSDITEHKVQVRHYAFSLSLLLCPSVLFCFLFFFSHIMKWNLEKIVVILYVFVATKFLNENVVPTQCAILHGICGTQVHEMVMLFYFRIRVWALFPHLSNKTWFPTHPYVPLGSYYATVFLVAMVVYGHMYVCMFLCVYIFGWMADGWMGECTVRWVFSCNQQFGMWHPHSKQLSLISFLKSWFFLAILPVSLFLI